MRILLAILLLTAATIRSQAAHAFFNFSDAIGVTTNCTVTIAPDRVYTDGTDQIVLPETLTYKGITNGSLTVSNIYAAGTNLIYKYTFQTSRTNTYFYGYAPSTNGIFNTWAFRVLKPSESAIGYTRGQVDSLIAAATNGITGGTNTGGLNTNAVIGIATNGTLPGLTVSGTAGLPGAIWFASSGNSNYGTWLQGPSTGTNGYIALPGTAGDGYLKATRDSSGIAVLTYDTPAGAGDVTTAQLNSASNVLWTAGTATNFAGLVITNKILYPLSGVWVGASGSDKVGFYDPVADELTSFQSNGVWHAESIISGAVSSASFSGNGTGITNIPLRSLQTITPGWSTNTVIDLNPATGTNYWIVDVTNNINIRLTNLVSGSWAEITLLTTNSVASNYLVNWVFPPTAATRFWYGSTNTTASSNKAVTISINCPRTNVVKLVTSTSL